MARLELQGLDKLGARAAFGGERSTVQAAPSLAIVLSSQATTESQAEAAEANDSRCVVSPTAKPARFSALREGSCILCLVKPDMSGASGMVCMLQCFQHHCCCKGSASD